MMASADISLAKNTKNTAYNMVPGTVVNTDVI